MSELQTKIENAFLRTFYSTFTYLKRPSFGSGEKLDLSKFYLTFEDNFDSGGIDSTKWHVQENYNRKGGYWDKSQAFIKDDNLIIRTQYKPDGRLGAGYYSTCLDGGGLFEQTFGYFECRCKLPAAKGIWSAFWFMPHNQLAKGVPPQSGVEIDVFESPMFAMKKNDFITSNLHYGGYGIGHRIKVVGFFKAVNPYTQFNTYGLEWNKNEYIFYINGIETARVKGKWVSQCPESMLLSVEVDGIGSKPSSGWSGVITDNPPGTLPVDFVVDYVKAYQYNDLNNN